MNVEQKEIAIKCLEALDIYKPYIRKFKSKAGIPCFFENFAGFYADQEPELWEKIKEVQTTTGCLVYAIVHELTDFGEIWSMLCVSRDPDSLDDFLIEKGGNQFYTYAYVWNKSNPQFSEFGDVVVKSAYGGLKRIH
jgi:hypothetical protein